MAIAIALVWSIVIIDPNYGAKDYTETIATSSDGDSFV